MKVELKRVVVDVATDISDLMRSECQKGRDGIGRVHMWQDSVASYVRRQIRLRIIPEKYGYLGDEFLDGFELFVHNDLYVHLLLALASAFGVYVLNERMGFRSETAEMQDNYTQMQDNLSGEFTATLEKTSAGKDWAKRLLASNSEQRFWMEAQGVLERYFEFALANPAYMLRHAYD